MSKDFFTEKQGAAAMKHALLKRYLPVFVGKTGSTSGGTVFYIDAFAGPGEYDDGEMGSPLIALDLHYALRRHRNLRGICIEKDTQHFADLSERLKRVPGWDVMHGTAEDCLPAALKRAEGHPTFVFLDPFALKGMSFDTILTALKRVGKTELLIRVHTEAVNRIAGVVMSQKKTAAQRESVMAANDNFLGGDWWRSLPSLGTDEFVPDVLHEYVTRLANKGGGYGYYYFPIEESPGGAPKYWLVHMTQYTLALWEMACQMSLSRKDAREQAALLDPEGQAALFDPEEDDWITEIRANALAILQDKESFVPCENAASIFGSSLGYARETHVRQAFRQMLNAGEISTDPKGKLAQLRIHR